MVCGMSSTEQRFHILAITFFVGMCLTLDVGSARAQDAVPVLISAQVGETAEEVFRAYIWEQVVRSRCINCHVEGGLSGHTRLVFERNAEAAEHLQSFVDFLDAAGDDHDHAHQHGHELILVKIQGAGHGGGVQAAAGSENFNNMDRFLALLEVEEEFHHRISQPIVQSRCVNCHVEGGPSEHTRLVLVPPADEDDHEALNLQAFRNLVAALEAQGERGASYILDKIQGLEMHGGGVQVAAGSDEFHDMEHFLELLEEGPHGFVDRLLEALHDAQTLMMITTPADENTVAGNAVAISASSAPTEAVHFAYRLDGNSDEAFAYLGAAANRGAALYAWDTTAMMDGDYELAVLYTEDEADSVTHHAIGVTLDNIVPADTPDIVENMDHKEQAVEMDARNEVVTADGVMVTLPGGALDADDRVTIAVMNFPDADAAPGEGVGVGTIDITLNSGQSTLREAVTVAIPYYEGKPDGIVHGTDIPETELSLWYFDADSDAWERVAESMVQPNADRVAADVTQTGEYGIFHTPMMMAEQGDEDAMHPDSGEGGGGGCAMLPVMPPGGPPDDPTLIGLLGLVTVYLIFGRRRLRHQAAMG